MKKPTITEKELRAAWTAQDVPKARQDAKMKGWRTPERDIPCEPTPALVIDLTNAVHVRVSADITPAGLQTVLQGAERASDATMAQRRALAPMKPKANQRPCDVGLFSDEKNQTSLF